MSHIHAKQGQHDQTVSAFIVRTDTGAPKLMLHKHTIIGKFLQFGGHIELDETPPQALAREIREETGYELSQLQILQPPLRIRSLTDTQLHPVPIYSQTHLLPADFLHYHTDLGFVFVVSEAPRSKPQEGESTDIALFESTELDSIPDKEIYPNVRETGKFILGELLGKWEQLPATELI